MERYTVFMDEQVIVKMSTLPQAIYRFDAIPTKYQELFLTELEQRVVEICVEPQKTPNSQSNPEKQEQSWRHHSPGFKLGYKAVVIKQYGTGRKTNRTEQSPEINPHFHGQILTKEARIHTRGKRQPLQLTVLGKLDQFLTSHTKKLKWIKGFIQCESGNHETARKKQRQ